MESVIQFIPLAFWTVVLGIPCWVLLEKTGFTRWWMLFLALPVVGPVIIIWVVAFRKWPSNTIVGGA